MIRRAVTQRAIAAASSAARGGVRAAAEGAEKSHEFAQRTGAAAADFRASLREIATLSGKRTVDDDMVGQMLGLIEQTGATPQEAVEFTSVYKGAAGAAINRHAVSGGKLGMSKETAAALMPEALKFTARTEMDTETGAKMAALLGEYVSIPDVETAMNLMGRIQGHLNVQGVGTMRQLGRPFFSLMGEFAGEGGRIADPERLAATYAATTVRSKSASTTATEMKQADRGLQDLIGNPLYGIQAGEDYTASVRKLAATFKGKTNLEKKIMLREAGLGNETEISSMIKQAEVADIVEVQMKNPEVAMMGRDALKLNQEYMDSEVGKTYQAEAKVFKSEITRGMQTERVGRLRAEARAKLMTEPGKHYRTGDTYQELTGSIVGLIQSGSGMDVQSEREDEVVVEGLRNRAKAVGYDIDRQHPHLRGNTGNLGMPTWMNPNRTYDSAGQRREDINAADAAIALLEAAKKLDAAGQRQMDANPAGRPPGNAGAAPMRP